MPTCPVCKSNRIVVVVSSKPKAFCSSCGARWTQKGAEQRAVYRLDGSSFNISAISVHPPISLTVVPRGRTA